jgi:hypothetical protein
MTHLIKVKDPLASLAIEGRSWTWAWAGDDASPVAWAGLVDAGGAAADLLGLLPSVPGQGNYVGASTGNVSADGSGSARVDQAVLIQDRASAGYTRAEPSGFVGIAADTAFTFRIILNSTFRTPSAGFFRLALAASPTKLFELVYAKVGDVPTVTAQYGNDPGAELVAVADAQPYEDEWALIDVVFLPEQLTGLARDELRIYLGGALVASASLAAGVFTNDDIPVDAAVGLMPAVAGGHPQFDRILFAGLAVGTALTQAQHRDDADTLGLRTDGLATAGHDWDRAYVGDMAADGVLAWSSFRPFGPPADDVAVRALPLSTEGLLLDADTAPLHPEGLGRPRINRAVQSIGPDDTFTSGDPVLFDLAEDFVIRLVVYTGPGPASDLFAQFNSLSPADAVLIENVGAATLRVTVGAFVMTAPIPGGPFPMDERIWYLIDVNYGATDGAGGAAQLTVRINDTATVVDHTGPLTGQVGGAMSLLSRPDRTSGAPSSDGGERVAFAGVLLGGLIDSVRHHIDAVALGVF